MQGTEKQIKWAEDIKARYLDDTHQALTRTYGVAVEREEWNAKYNCMGRVQSKELQGKAAQAWDTIQAVADEQEDAKWWIDNRDNIRVAIKTASSEYAKRHPEDPMVK